MFCRTYHAFLPCTIQSRRQITVQVKAPDGAQYLLLLLLLLLMVYQSALCFAGVASGCSEIHHSAKTPAGIRKPPPPLLLLTMMLSASALSRRSRERLLCCA
jgi:hypothetical protein